MLVCSWEQLDEQHWIIPRPTVSLLDRFRPKWQHSDTEVRADAVRQLTKDDAELLAAVAQSDPDPRVRRIAVKKLDDPKLLLEIGRTDPDDGLRAFAKERAGDILVEIAVSEEDRDQSLRAVAHLSDPRPLALVAKTAVFDDVRRAAVARITDNRVLADIVQGSDDPAVRSDAMDRISDASALRIVISDASSDLAVSAVEKIDDVDVLRAIVDDRSSQKDARRHAERKLNELIEDDHPIRLEERKSRLVELCMGVENLARESDLDKAISGLRDAESQWEEILGNVPVETDLQARFGSACRVIIERQAKVERKKAEQAQRGKQVEENLSARALLCERLEASTGEDVLGELERIQSAWDELAVMDDPRVVSLTKRFAAARESALGRLKLRREIGDLQTRLEAVVAEAESLLRASGDTDTPRQWLELKKTYQELKTTAHPKDVEQILQALDARMDDVGTRLLKVLETERERRREVQQDNLKRIRELQTELESLAQTEDLVLKDAFRAIADSQIFLKEMGPLPPSENRKKWRAKLSESRQKLHLRVQDFRETDEWRRWANVDLQNKLIQKMEALAATDDLRDAAKQIRDLQKEWKQVSAVPRDQAELLWQRFKKARDEVRARCDVFFSTLDKERTENLERKKVLCERVEALVESTNWEKTAQEIKSLQQEWKQIGAVPQKESNAVWKRFRKACDQFFDRRKGHYSGLKQEREENLRAKIDLCEKAEAVADSTDWKATAEELKRLQLEWKKIGPVPRKKSESVWKRFRKACDHFFERYKRRDEVELAENLGAKEGICRELESLLVHDEGAEAPNPKIVAEKLQGAWSAWRRIGPVPKQDERDIEARFRRVCDNLLPTASESLRGTDLDASSNRKKKERICERLEELVDSVAPHGAVAEGSLESLAERLKSALAARTIGGDIKTGGEVNWRDATQQVKRLKNNWERLGPVPGEEGRALTARFQKAYSKFFQLRPGSSTHSSRSSSAESSAG